MGKILFLISVLFSLNGFCDYFAAYCDQDSEKASEEYITSQMNEGNSDNLTEYQISGEGVENPDSIVMSFMGKEVDVEYKPFSVKKELVGFRLIDKKTKSTYILRWDNDNLQIRNRKQKPKTIKCYFEWV